MSYEPLALRYRPRLFSDMVGEEHVTSGLRAAIEGDRVAHAYLFSGPRGTGKTTTARILARCLNCEKGPAVEPCGTCSTCQAILEGASLDVLELDAASQRKVEDTEDWVSTVHLVPMGRYKVYIVDEVHMFSKASFNLLLKTFEEPPAHVVFVLATTEPEKVPATVRGRCQRFDFRLIPHDVLVQRYAWVCEREGVEAEPGALELIARQAAGSVRDGLTLLDQALSDDGKSVALARVRALTGAVDRSLLSETVGLMTRGDAAGVFPLVARVADAGADLRRFAEDLIAHLRGVMLAAAGASPARLIPDVDDTVAEEMVASGRDLGVDGATARLTAVADVAREIDNEPVGRITLEAALVRCCLMGRGAGSDLAVRVAALEEGLRATERRSSAAAPPDTPPPATPPSPTTATNAPASPAPPPATSSAEGSPPTPATPVEPPSTPAGPPQPPGEPGPATTPPDGGGLQPAELQVRWRDVGLSVGPVARALLEGSRPVGMDGSVLRVSVGQEFIVRKLADRHQEIDAAVARIFGTGVRAVFEAGAASGADSAPAPMDDSEPDVDLSELRDAPPADAISVVDLVRQGFAAEVIEEYQQE